MGIFGYCSLPMAAHSVDVATTLWGMEYSIHECPKKHAENLVTLFPGVDVSNMLVIPTCQNSDVDLVRTGEPIEQEKDRLLERFMKWAQFVCDKLNKEGHFSDYIDPCSGLPMVNKNNQCVYGEVDALSTLLGYKTTNSGCCKVILHPKWGTSVYPASMFTKAPKDVFLAAVKSAEDALA